MMYKKKPTEQLTMFRCAKCDRQLNTTEFAQGVKCVRCIFREKGRIAPIERKEMEEAAIKEMISSWGDINSGIPLTEIEVNYIGIMYQVSVWHNKNDSPPHATITDKDGVIIYHNGNHKNEGLSVFQYCINNDLLTKKTT